MFCPNCSTFLTEKDLIKSKMKTWEDAEIEYQATCPFCEEMIGRMFWGQLVVRPELLEKYEAIQKQMILQEVIAAPRAAAPAQPEEPYLDPPLPEEEPYLVGPDGAEMEWDAGEPGDETSGYYAPSQLSGHYCPHCGKDLPNDLDLLPRRFSY